jgi:hypothetical protein
VRFGDRPCDVIGWELRELGDEASLHFADECFLTLHHGHSKSVAPWVPGSQVRRQTKLGGLGDIAFHATLYPRNVTFGQVTSMVSLANSTYCPIWRCWATQC